VVRIWDVNTGRLLRSIRGQIGDGFEGKIYALALSPDDRFLAVGGWLAGDSTDSRAIRLHDFSTGEVIGLFKGHKNVVEGLAFSPDGRQLASASADQTVQLWDVAQRRSLKMFTDHKNEVHAVAFSPDGLRLASAGLDFNVCLWDVPGRRRIICRADHQNQVASVVFSPDGRYLISSGVDGTVRLWDGRTGAPLGILAMADAEANLTFTPDGSRLLITTRSSKRYLCQLLSMPGGDVVREFTAHDDLIYATAISPDGRLAATAGGSRNQIHIWELATSREAREISGVGQPFRSVAFAKDGNSIAFGTSSYDTQKANEYGPLEQIIRLSGNGGGELSFSGVPRDADYRRSLDHYQSDSLTTLRAGLNQDPVTLQVIRDGRVRHGFTRDKTSGYRHTCYTFTPDGRYIISGGIGGVLSIYSVDDWKERRLIGHTGEVFSVAVSPDGRTLVSGSADQTMRLWDIPTGNNLLTVFAGSDSEWVAWTPEGYYTSSVGGDRYVGWHVNRGADQAAKYFSVAQFRKEFYKPEAVYERLRARDSRRAILSAAGIRRMLPPSIRFAGVGEGPIVSRQRNYHVRLEVISESLPITDVSLFVNGSRVTLGPTRGDPLRRDVEIDVPLRSGTNVLAGAASNGSADAVASPITVTLPEGLPDTKPSLYVLAVGISEYQDKSWNLNFAALDAEAVAAVLKKQQSGRLFGAVSVTVLTNQRATRAAIQNALGDTVARASPGDTVVAFFAGHGYLDSAGDYYLATPQHVKDDNAFDLEWRKILQTMTRGKGAAVLLVDTCHAAGISSNVNFTQLMRGWSTDGSGLYTFAASTERETAEERTEWKHGAFTAALLQSLGAGYDDQYIFSDALGVHIRQAVTKLGAHQHPTHFVLPLGLPAEPLFAPMP
jgi:WD40 repeat protein